MRILPLNMCNSLCQSLILKSLWVLFSALKTINTRLHICSSAFLISPSYTNLGTDCSALATKTIIEPSPHSASQPSHAVCQEAIPPCPCSIFPGEKNKIKNHFFNPSSFNISLHFPSEAAIPQCKLVFLRGKENYYLVSNCF